MKKLSTCLLAFVLLIAFSTNSNEAKAQSNEGEVVISAGVGWGILHGLLTALGEGADQAGIENKAVPPIFAHIDYGINEGFSIGGAYTVAQYTFGDTWIDSTTTPGNSTIENVELQIRRTNIAVRPLFHFGNGETMDLYAGPRIGVTMWNTEVTGSNLDPADQDYDGLGDGTNFAVQALFGARAYITDNIGANFEVGLGTAPYFVAFGLAARF